MQTPRTAPLAVLVIATVVIAACGGGSGSDASTASRSTTTRTYTRHEKAQARVSGTQGAAHPAGFGTCLEAAGFASAPPGHGVAAQWSHPDGVVVAVSTDTTQMATIAAQFSTADAPADVLAGGVIIAGTGTAATAARACVAGR